MDWGDVPTWLASIAALAALWFAHRSRQAAGKSEAAEVEAKRQAKAATDAAEKAATAQQETAQEAKRLADAMEKRTTDEERKPWRIENRNGTFYLVNTTAKRKFFVRLSNSEIDFGGFDGEPEAIKISVDGHDRVPINVDAFRATGDPAVVVWWQPSVQQKPQPDKQTITLPLI